MSTEPTTRVVNLINFHGLTLWVMEHEGTEYIQAKPLADLAGVDWRGAKRTLQESHNLILYGTKWLDSPVFSAEGGTASPGKPILCVRLDRSRIYVARINTRLMASKGQTEAAEALLQLQIEWAEALHRYETDGVAYKKAEKEERNQLIALLKARQQQPTQNERQAITRMIRDTFSDLGYPVEKDPQGELDL